MDQFRSGTNFFLNLHKTEWTFYGKHNTQWSVKSNPPTTTEILESVPPLIRGSLIQFCRTAYNVTDQIATDFPILAGPLQAAALGQIRYALVSHVVDRGVEEGLIPGNASWLPLANGSGRFLEYSYNGVRLTFASSHAVYKLPKTSDFRMSRANDNQLTFFPEMEKYDDDRPALILLHGYKKLDFAQLVVPGLMNDKIIGLDWTSNLVAPGDSGEQGLGGAGHGPHDPIPAEPLAEIALEIRNIDIEQLKEIGQNDQ